MNKFSTYSAALILLALCAGSDLRACFWGTKDQNHNVMVDSISEYPFQQPKTIYQNACRCEENERSALMIKAWQFKINKIKNAVIRLQESFSILLPPKKLPSGKIRFAEIKYSLRTGKTLWPKKRAQHNKNIVQEIKKRVAAFPCTKRMGLALENLKLRLQLLKKYKGIV